MKKLSWEQKYGKKKAEEMKHKASLRMKNRIISQETKNKISKTIKEKYLHISRQNIIKHNKERKGKTYEDIYGKERAEEEKRKRQETRSKNWKGFDTKTKQRISESVKRYLNTEKGKKQLANLPPQTEEQKKASSIRIKKFWKSLDIKEKKRRLEILRQSNIRRKKSKEELAKISWSLKGRKISKKLRLKLSRAQKLRSSKLTLKQKREFTLEARNKLKVLWGRGINIYPNRKGRNNNSFGKTPKNIFYSKRFKVNSPLQGEINLRSSYEYEYYKYLIKNNIKFLYESKTFDLGDTTYTPDFYLVNKDLYVEIKGYFRKEAKLKIKKTLYKYDINFKILFKKDLQKLGCKIK